MNRFICFEMIFDTLASYSDVVVVVTNIKRSDHSMISFSYCEWGSMRHNKINIIKLFPALNHCCDKLLVMKFLEGVVGAALPHRIKKYLILWHSSFSGIQLSHSLSKYFGCVLKFWIDYITMRVLLFGQPGWWSK